MTATAKGFFELLKLIKKQGDRIIAGAPGSNSNTGLVRVLEEENGEWVQVGQDINGEALFDRFGGSVGMNDSGDS